MKIVDFNAVRLAQGSTLDQPSTAVTIPSTALPVVTAPSSADSGWAPLADALVPLDQPILDGLQLVRDHWRRPQTRKAIAALLALYPKGPPIGRMTKEMVAAVQRFCVDPERAWTKPNEKTIRDAIKIVWPWLFLR
jgi:hypothetical protein